MPNSYDTYSAKIPLYTYLLFLVPSMMDLAATSFDVLIAATEIKGWRLGVDKINVKLMLNVAVLPHLASV